MFGPKRGWLVAGCVVVLGCSVDLHGQVTEGRTGEPLNGVTLIAYGGDCDWELTVGIPLPTDCRTTMEGMAGSQPDGSYVMHGLPHGHELGIDVHLAGYVGRREPVTIPRGGMRMDFELFPLPPPPIEDLEIRGVGDGVLVTWIPPADDRFAGALVIRLQDTTTLDDDPPEPGHEYALGEALGAAIAVYSGTDVSFLDRDVVDGSHYIYTAYAYSDFFSYSGPVMYRNLTFDGTPPPPVTDLTAAETLGGVELAWLAPPEATGAIAVHTLDAELTGGPADGDRYEQGDPVGDGVVAVRTVYLDTDRTTRRTAFGPGVGVNHYTVFAFDDALNYSTPVSVTFEVAP